jgi:RNA polymerase sigma-70 factor (ECF subfamily)
MAEAEPGPPSARAVDAALLARIAVGDAEALGALHDRHAGMLQALVRRIVDDRSDAEDIVQEVFLQVWHQAARYDPRRSAASTWLVLIARSRAIDRLRTRRVVARTAEQFQHENGDPYASPDEGSGVQGAKLRERVRAVLATLPPEQRQVLELAFFSDLSQTEIAERTSTPLGTVKTRTLLAMKKLRQALNQEIRELL